MSLLIVFNGMPGTGKTTLSRQLAADLHMPLLGKDQLKEFLYEKLKGNRGEDSKFIGRASIDMLYVLTRQYVAAGKDFIVENAFWREFSRPFFMDLQKQYDVMIIEVYCQTEGSTWHARFNARHASGARHSAHSDRLGDYEAERKKYAPIGVGQHITIDTTVFGDAVYAQLRQQVISCAAKLSVGREL